MNPMLLNTSWSSEKREKIEHIICFIRRKHRTLIAKTGLTVLLMILFHYAHTQGSVMGKITTESGKPIENVCVDIKKDGKVVEYVHTDKKGMYTVEDLEEGKYDFIVYYRMEEKKLKNISVYQNRPTFNKITLVKKPPVIPYYAGDNDLAIQE